MSVLQLESASLGDVCRIWRMSKSLQVHFDRQVTDSHDYPIRIIPPLLSFDQVCRGGFLPIPSPQGANSSILHRTSRGPLRYRTPCRTTRMQQAHLIMHVSEDLSVQYLNRYQSPWAGPLVPWEPVARSPRPPLSRLFLARPYA